MKENKTFAVLSIIAIAILILAAVGLTYAFFSTQIDNDTNVDLKTETPTETEVIYTTDANLVMENAEPGFSKELTFNIELTASNKSDDTITYGVDWIIDNNDFSYELENPNDPQLVYSIYYSYDNSVWSPVKENVDCTTATGTINLAENQILTTNVGTTKNVYWKFVLLYKSYNYNQATNMSKNLSGTIEVTGLN